MPMKPPNVFTLYVRSTLDPGTIQKMVTRETAALGSGMRVTGVTTLSSLVGGTIVTERLLADVGGAAALLGLVLAAIGLFGLLNYSVTERTQEIGIRTALGARRSRIYTLVLKDVARVIALGFAAGLGSALIVIHWTRSLLFGVSSVDPAVISAAMLTFLVTAAVACALPARRAAAIDPVIALRRE
jgi:ABC-type antimicrobial peptide transport system permease subunit